MALGSIVGAFLPSLISGVAGLFGNKSSGTTTKKENFTRDDVTASTGIQTDLPAELLAQLGGLFGGIVNTGAGQAAQDATRSRLNELRSFDPAAYAKSVTDQAASVAGIAIDSGVNGATMQAGGRGNTMTRLLESKIRNETAANLAGISAQARATGEDIANRGTAGLTESLMRGITDLVAVTRGAATQGEKTDAAASKGTGNTSGAESAVSGGGLGGFFSGLSSGLTTYWNSLRQ